ncbi:MAG: hypothetical protein RJA70_1940 [Pseudomonadota bacterium]|jgi:hypothetical protein
MAVRSLRASFTLCGVLAATPLVSGCGAGAQQPAEPSDMNDDSRSRESDLSQVGVTAEVGALPEAETGYAFKQSFKGIERCLTQASERIEFFGGEFAVKVLVNAQGKAEHIFAERTTLGDSRTEECMFDVLRSAPWPRPVGGLVGIAQNAFEFEMTGDVRSPIPWSQSNVQSTLDEKYGAIAGCKRGSAGIHATLYIDTDGHPLSVGIGGTEPSVEEARPCLVRVLKGATFPSPGSWPAKVTVQL